MHRYKTKFVAGALALALAAPFVGVGPAGAAPAPAGCNAGATPGAEIGQYPAQPASQSSLVVSCAFPNNPGNNQASSKFTIHDFDVAQYHNGAARSISPSGAVASGATTFTAANFTGITTYVNRSIAGTGIAPRSFVKSVSAGGLVTLSNPTTAALTTASVLKIDNAAGARSRVDVTTATGSTTITSATANFQAATDVGLSVTGTDIPDGTTIASVTNATTAVLSAAATGPAVANAVISFGGSLLVTTTRQANDATKTASVITSVAAKFKTTDIGLPVYGTGIPANTFITAVAGNNATTTGAMTASAGPDKVVIGDPSATAPTSTDQIAFQGVQLDLNPGLVSGSENCSAENTEGFATVARWNNPGSFTGSALFNTQPAGTKAIGQIYFDTAVADFSAFVVEKANTLVAGQFLYDIVFPNVPTTSAMCPSTATSPGLGFSLRIQATTLSQATLPSGTGRPSTAQFRALLPSSTGYTSTATIQSDDPLITFSPAPAFTRICGYPAGAAQVSFKCGNG